MGEVYEVEQQEPIRRKVALKVVKHGMDTKAVVARFESERQALAMMNHATIAKVYEAGVTANGRPYFAMEFVKGIPITDHCDRARLNTRGRLELFMQVCEGVQHAHQKAIIHRDLKPSNVLVAIQNGKAVPKIIDFGVAKATAHPLTEKTMFTALGQLIGTPEFMSPEQAEMTGQNIDTRTDVYALGAVLYVLLVGALPFDSETLRQGGFDELRRRIREVDPPRPSTRFGTLADAAATSAEQRGTDPSSLTRQLKGDLDWIVMKALEKDRTRRYGSPSEMAADIDRHLRHVPVQARPPSTSDRVVKFVRRHKVAVAAAGALLSLLVVFAAMMTFQAARIAQQRNRANQEAAAATQLAEVLNDLFDLSDPGEALGRSITVRELLDVGLDKVRRSLADQPRELTRFLGVIGSYYRELGQYDKAEPLLKEAVERRRELLGQSDPDTLTSMSALASLYKDQGRYEDAEPLFLETLDARRRVLGEQDETTLTSMNDLAGLYWKQGRYDEAEALYVDTLAAQRRLLGEGHPNTLASMNDLAGLYWNQGRFDEAETLYVDTLEARRRLLGEDHKDTAETMNDLAVLYSDGGRHREAEPLYLQALEIRRHVLSDVHPVTLQVMNNLALLYDKQGRYDEAEPLYLELLTVQRRVLGPGHPETLIAMNNLAGLYSTQARYDESEPLYVEVLRSLRGLLGEDHPHTLGTMGNLGDLYTKQGRPAEAEPLLAAAVEGARRALPQGHVITGVNIRKYGSCLLALKRYDEAEQALLEAHGVVTAAVGTEHEQTLKVVRALVELYEAAGKPDQAGDWRDALPEGE
jgi:non-specific serine/threonine protein kinase/serine/threonine-protein kinase